ncbi:MAG: glycosyl transferase, partial [Acidobacteria bacterium]
TEWGSARLPDFLKERDGYYDQIIVSRPHNMKTFRSRFWVGGTWSTSARVIYDAEAVVSFREAEQRRLYGSQMTDAEVAQLLSDEMSLARGVHAVLSVTDRERDCFVSSGIGTAWTVGHIVPVNPTPRAFAERAGFLFVGAMGGIPNRDAVLWFGREIWPKIRSVVGGETSFAVVGGHAPAELRTFPGVDVLGQVPDLTSLYNRSRIFVAPSRLAAGIPIKVQTAAAHGLPVVCTSILAEELGWDDGVELLVADDPEQFARCCVRLYSDEDLWQRLRKHALSRVARECSQEAFTVALAQALA